MGRPPSLNLTGSHTNIRQSRYALYLKVADGLVPLLDVRASLNLVDGEASLADTLADLRVRRDTLCEDHRVHVWFLRCFLKRRSVVGSKVSSPTC
jgi:hypothetical protein